MVVNCHLTSFLQFNLYYGDIQFDLAGKGKAAYNKALRELIKTLKTEKYEKYVIPFYSQRSSQLGLVGFAALLSLSSRTAILGTVTFTSARRKQSRYKM